MSEYGLTFSELELIIISLQTRRDFIRPFDDPYHNEERREIDQLIDRLDFVNDDDEADFSNANSPTGEVE